jgi:RNA polymerase sigma-70 factor (ECF subfamily)
VWSPRGPLPQDELHDVYRAHVSAVYAFFAYSVSHDVAEDLTAATFERVVRHWARFDPARSSQRTWILAIARHLLSDHFRRQSHRAGPSLEEYPELVDRAPAVEDPAAHQTSIETLREWLVRLNPREREVLALRYGADLSSAAIARTLGMTEANVLQISSRALRRLRAELEEIDDRPRISDTA